MSLLSYCNWLDNTLKNNDGDVIKTVTTNRNTLFYPSNNIVIILKYDKPVTHGKLEIKAWLINGKWPNKCIQSPLNDPILITLRGQLTVKHL